MHTALKEVNGIKTDIINLIGMSHPTQNKRKMHQVKKVNGFLESSSDHNSFDERILVFISCLFLGR